ncbi:hypothetical protein GGTG_07356 [Gaeumannomyces tritici R3-111a-1]|uniref:Clock-controlled protein 8 n=1 Tax=Gaeumannomyces tritici (strain R3-111a-1) TaxID=644352 RepID=J3P1F9_GAET3|nr:hypothetical protein GGTG_07356 [Gaeumannomyces tritici R3-111a-1]EJT77444.1 hypothetical protein GGTG_07356 [Gaeumannomyces tritici R3-111a-1]
MEAQHHMRERQQGCDDAKSPPEPALPTLPPSSSLFPHCHPPPSPPPPPPPSLGLPSPASFGNSLAGGQANRLDQLSFPDVPTHELAPISLTAAQSSSLPSRDTSKPAAGDAAITTTLPPISALTDSLPSSLSPRSVPASSASPPTQVDRRHPSPPRLTEWPSLNPYTTFYSPSHAQAADSPGKMDVEMSGTRAGSVSLDDPDVRMAAEALGDLRADFVSTPQQQQHPEPLLQLLTTSHPLLAKTIEGTTSAYNTSKNFSPRFKSGAEYVEGYLTPIGNTLGSVGRVTGVEGGVRWFLRGARRQPPPSSDLESGDGARNKRRRMMGTRDGSDDSRSMGHDDRPSPTTTTSAVTTPTPSEFDPFAFRSKERRTSMSTVDTLPAYDDHRSPAYTEDARDERSGSVSSPRPQSSSSGGAAWQSRLILSTSGLSVAMSEESLRSLKYCLQWLRWANDHIAKVIGTLKATLEQFEQQQKQQNPDAEGNLSTTEITVIIDPNAMVIDEEPGQIENAELGQRVAALKSDVLKTLRAVIETVSKYAGGALPENARVLVRRHLTSLPQRFRLASQADPTAAGPSTASEKDVREGAQRVLLLAQEGLDMMAQVSGVLDGTIVSAEEWCSRLGKRKQEEREALGRQSIEPLTGVGIDGDVKMG